MKAERGILDSAARLGPPWGRSQVSQPCDKGDYSLVPLLPTPAEDAVHRASLFLGVQDAELSCCLLTEGDSGAGFFAVKHRPLCSLRQRAGGD